LTGLGLREGAVCIWIVFQQIRHHIPYRLLSFIVFDFLLPHSLSSLLLPLLRLSAPALPLVAYFLSLFAFSVVLPVFFEYPIFIIDSQVLQSHSFPRFQVNPDLVIFVCGIAFIEGKVAFALHRIVLLFA